MFTWDLFLQVGIYHSQLPSWNCFYFIPQIQVCYSSLFICLKVFIFLLIFSKEETAHLLFSSILIFVFNLFWLHWVSIVAHGLLVCVASLVVEHRLQARASVAAACRLSSCGSQAQLLLVMWDFPGPGIEPVFPALAGGFLSSVPPGKSSMLFYLHILVKFFSFLHVLNFSFISYGQKRCLI